MANVLVAVLATVLGYTTSAVVAEVRGDGAAAAHLVAADMPAQFRPIVSAEAPAFASTKAPGWRERTKAGLEMSAARAVAATRTIGAAR